MRAKILIPYYDYDNINFDVNDNYYKGNEYEDTLISSNNRDKDIINDYILSNNKVHKDSTSIKFFSIKNKANDENLLYTSCYCDVCNEYDMKSMSLEDFKMFENVDNNILIVKFDFNTIEEEFETDLKMWLDEHNKINSYDLDDEWKFKNEPFKDLVLEVDNLKYNLENCKILDSYEDKFIIFIEKIKNVI